MNEQLESLYLEYSKTNDVTREMFLNTYNALGAEYISMVEDEINSVKKKEDTQPINQTPTPTGDVNIPTLNQEENLNVSVPLSNDLQLNQAQQQLIQQIQNNGVSSSELQLPLETTTTASDLVGANQDSLSASQDFNKFLEQNVQLPSNPNNARLNVLPLSYENQFKNVTQELTKPNSTSTNNLLETPNGYVDFGNGIQLPKELLPEEKTQEEFDKEVSNLAKEVELKESGLVPTYDVNNPLWISRNVGNLKGADYVDTILQEEAEGKVKVARNDNGELIDENLKPITDKSNILWQPIGEYVKEYNDEVNKFNEEIKLNNEKVSKNNELIKNEKLRNLFLGQPEEEKSPLTTLYNRIYSDTGILLTEEQKANFKSIDDVYNFYALEKAKKDVKDNPELNYNEEYNKNLNEFNPKITLEQSLNLGNKFVNSFLLGFQLEEEKIFAEARGYGAKIDDSYKKGYASDKDKDEIDFIKNLSNNQVGLSLLGQWWNSVGQKEIGTSNYKINAVLSTKEGRADVINSIVNFVNGKGNLEKELANENIVREKFKNLNNAKLGNTEALKNSINYIQSESKKINDIETQQKEVYSFIDEWKGKQVRQNEVEQEFSKTFSGYQKGDVLPSIKFIAGNTINGISDAFKSTIGGVAQLPNLAIGSDEYNDVIGQITKPTDFFGVKTSGMFSKYYDYESNGKKIRFQNGNYYEVDKNGGYKPIDLTYTQIAGLGKAKEGEEFSIAGMFGDTTRMATEMALAEFTGGLALKGLSKFSQLRNIPKVASVFGEESALTTSLQRLERFSTNPTNNGYFGWFTQTVADNYQEGKSKGMTNTQAAVYGSVQSLLTSFLSRINPDVKFFKLYKELDEKLIGSILKNDKQGFLNGLKSMTNQIGGQIVGEEGQELTEQLAQEVVKQFTNTQLSDKKFDKMTSDDVLKTIITTAVTTGALSSANIVTRGNVDNVIEYDNAYYNSTQLSNGQKLVMLANLNTAEIFKNFERQFITDKSKLSEVEKSVSLIKNYLDKIPNKEQYTLNTQTKAVSLLYEIDKKRKQLNQSDEVFKSEVQTEIDNLSGQLKELLDSDIKLQEEVKNNTLVDEQPQTEPQQQQEQKGVQGQTTETNLQPEQTTTATKQGVSIDLNAKTGDTLYKPTEQSVSTDIEVNNNQNIEQNAIQEQTTAEVNQQVESTPNETTTTSVQNKTQKEVTYKGKVYKYSSDENGEFIISPKGKRMTEYTERELTKYDEKTKKYVTRKIRVANANFRNIKSKIFGEKTQNEINEEYKSREKEALSHLDDTNEKNIALLYFAQGGKVSYDSIKTELGEKVAKELTWGYLGKDGEDSIERVSERLAENSNNPNISQTEIRNKLIEVLGSHGSVKEIKETIVQAYNKSIDPNFGYTDEDIAQLEYQSLPDNVKAIVDSVNAEATLTEEEKLEYEIQEYEKQLQSLSNEEQDQIYNAIYGEQRTQPQNESVQDSITEPTQQEEITEEEDILKALNDLKELNKNNAQKQASNVKYNILTQGAFDKLIERLKKPFAKAFKNLNVTTDWKAFLEQAKKLGVSNADIQRMAVNFESDASTAYEAWSNGYREVSGNDIQDIKTGQPVIVRAYHGTTHEFYTFDSEVKGNIEGHLGKVNYFTSEFGDASGNYLSDGADITGRIDSRQEELENTLRYDYQSNDEGLNFQEIIDDFNITDEEVNELYPNGKPEFIQAEEISRFLAEKELKGTDEKVLELYVKLNNPIVLGNGATWFDALEIDEVYLEEATQEIAEEYDITEEEAKSGYEFEIRDRAIEKQGDYNKIVEALEEALDDNGYDSSLASDILGDNYYESKVDLNQIEKDLRKAELYENYDDELASTQVIADFFKNLGFDSIILTDVSDRFRNMGLHTGVSHIHIFNEFNNQIKLADGTNTTFTNSSDIRYMYTENGEVYGAKLPDGTIYINPKKLNANTAIHEFSHLWEQLMPTTWKKGVDIFKQTAVGKKIYNQLKNEGNYSNLTDNELWSEALNTHIGNYGEWKLSNSQTKMGELVSWLKGLFNKIGNYFGFKLNPETNLEQFTKSVVKDLLGGKPIIGEITIGEQVVKFSKVNQNNIPFNNVKEVVKEIQTNGLNAGLNLLQKTNWYKSQSEEVKNSITANNLIETLINSTEASIQNKAQKQQKAKVAKIENIKSAKEVIQQTILDAKEKGLFKGVTSSSVLEYAMRRINRAVTPYQQKQVLNIVKKIINDNEYLNKVKEAVKTQKDIKTKANSKSISKPLVNVNIAKEFAKINPRNVKDIDEFLALAKAVKSNLSGIAVNNKLEVKNKNYTINNESIQKYIDDNVKYNETLKEEALQDDYNELARTNNLPVANMTFEEYKDFINLSKLEENATKFDDESKATKEERTKVLSAIVNKRLNNDFKTEVYDKKSEFTEAEQTIIERLSKIDTSTLDYKQLVKLNDIINNAVYNGDLMDAGSFSFIPVVQENGKKIDEFKEKNNYNFLTLKTDLASEAAQELITNDMLIEFMTNSTDASVVLKINSGISKIMNGNAKASIQQKKAVNTYIKMKEKAGWKSDTTENRYIRQIYAEMVRDEGGNEDEKSIEFTRKKGLIAQTFKALKDSYSEQDKKDGKLLEEIYNKTLGNANTVEEVKNNILKLEFGKFNIESVEYWIGVHDEYADDFIEQGRLYNNKDLEKEVNYTSRKYKPISRASQIKQDDEMFDEVRRSLNIKYTESGSKNKVRKRNNLPEGLVLDMDFDKVQSKVLFNNLYDLYTLEGISILKEFLKDPKTADRIGGKSNVDKLTDMMRRTILSQKQAMPFENSKTWKLVDKVSESIMLKSTRLALGSIEQLPQQYLSVLFNTAVNLGTDVDLLFKAYQVASKYSNYDFNPNDNAIQKGKKKIANFNDLEMFNSLNIGVRGTTIAGFNKKNAIFADENAGNVDKIRAVLYNGEKLAKSIYDATMKSLEFSDVQIARTSWLAFYMKSLRKQGIDLDKIDWSKIDEKYNEYANEYAQQKTALFQNANDPSSLPATFKNTDTQTRVIKNLVLPFSSFGMNTKGRMTNDMQKILLGSIDGRASAARSLVATLLESAIFNAFKIFVLQKASIYLTETILSSVFGWDDEEINDLFKKSKEKMTPKYIATTLSDFFFGGLGSFGQSSLESVTDFITKNLNGEEYFYHYKNDPEKSGIPYWVQYSGAYGVSIGTALGLYKDTQYLDGYGEEIVEGSTKPVIKEKELSSEAKKLAYLTFAIDGLAFVGIGDRAVTRVNQKIKIARDKRIKEDLGDWYKAKMYIPSNKDNFNKYAKLYVDKGYTLQEIRALAMKEGITLDKKFNSKMVDVVYEYKISKYKKEIDAVKLKYEQNKMSREDLKAFVISLDLTLKEKVKLWKELR